MTTVLGEPRRRVRPVDIAPGGADVRYGTDGCVYLTPPRVLGSYPVRLTDRLEHWAAQAPDRTFLAQRTGPAGEWDTVNYAGALRRVRRLAQGLLDRRMSPDRPLAILSGNGIDHGLLALAAMYAGIPYVPVAPAYSLQAREFTTLSYIFDRVRPRLVFVAEGRPFQRALDAVLGPDVELVVASAPPDGRPATRLADLEAEPAADVDAARDAVGPHTIAKILFTSGSTGRPKGVINTQGMLCANQAMLSSVLRFLAEEPPVLCDWSPWNHTAGGNHNFGLVLYHGGTLYIDEGRPTPAHFDVTLRNLREVPCTAHFAVPRTYELLMPHLRSDAALRETFFRRLKLLFYAAAGLGQRFWDELREVSIEACGEEILIMTGFGCTETAPFALSTGPDGAFAGMIGLPAPGLELKLAPIGSKLEGRVRGPNVTPGYWRDEALTRAAFDEEGFYRLGDAMRFVDPADPRKGLIFDGRLAEDFKLSTGTWVSVGPLRARILAQAGGLAQDVVITGHDRAFVGALVFPDVARCRARAGLHEAAPVREVVAHPGVVGAFQEAFDTLARLGTGSSTFAARALLLEESPAIDAREITDKGSINQKAVLAHRAALLEELYAETPPPRVIVARADAPAGGRT